MFNSADHLWPRYWQQLSVMINAGLTIERALTTLADSTKDKQSKETLKRIISLVKRGQSLSTALKQTNSIVDADFTVLSIAEKSGKLPKGLNAIARRRSDWLLKVDNLKANLLLPKGLLLVGALAGLFVRIASAGQTFPAAFIAVASVLVVAWLFIMLTVWLIKCDSLAWLSLGWRVPLLRRRWLTYQLGFEEAFYRLLCWQIESGIAPDNALRASKSLLSAQSYQSNVVSAARRVSSGESIDEVLIATNLTLSQPLKRVLLTSIQVGTWDRALNHHLDVQRNVLELKAENFFKWLPRLYYFIALLAISKFMFA